MKIDSVSSQLLREIPTGQDVAKMNTEQRRYYYKIFKRWLDNLEDSDTELGDVMDKQWFRRWANEYEILEKRIEDLETCTKILEADPERLVSFSLDRYASLV